MSGVCNYDVTDLIHGESDAAGQAGEVLAAGVRRLRHGHGAGPPARLCKQKPELGRCDPWRGGRR